MLKFMSRHPSTDKLTHSELEVVASGLNFFFFNLVCQEKSQETILGLMKVFILNMLGRNVSNNPASTFLQCCKVLGLFIQYD